MQHLKAGSAPASIGRAKHAPLGSADQACTGEQENRRTGGQEEGKQENRRTGGQEDRRKESRRTGGQEEGKQEDRRTGGRNTGEQENGVKPLPHSQLGLRRKRRCQLADDALAFARWQHPDGGNERVAVQLADGTDSTIDGEELLKGRKKGEGGGKGVELTCFSGCFSCSGDSTWSSSRERSNFTASQLHCQ